MLSTTATMFLPWSSVAFGAGVFAIGSQLIPLKKSSKMSSEDSSPKPEQSELQFKENLERQIPEPSFTDSVNERLYRTQELTRIVASLKANASILVVGEEGSGKSTLATAVVEKLEQEEFRVAYCKPATSKQILLDIAQQLGVDTQNSEGKSLTADQLKHAIASHLAKNRAFLVIDGAHACDLKFRIWLKQLRRQESPMLLLATNPPRTDIFISIPRIELLPLPEYAIRELMEQAALSRGINLKHSDLAKLLERAGGNPMLAMRAIDEEYLGLEVEGADHQRYFDITPMILLVGIVFVVMRFIGLGINDQALYIFGGIAAAVFLGISRRLYNLPRESRRIQS